MRKIVFIIAVASLAACAAPVTSESVFNELALQVDDEIRKAEAAGFLWRDTDQYLHQARLARQQGQDELAMTLGATAMRQARLALQQAKENADATSSYPNN